VRAATQCRYQGEEMDIVDALALRDRSNSRPYFTCIHCDEPVRAHRAGAEHSEAHFEHHELNSECPYSAGTRVLPERFPIEDSRAIEGYKRDITILSGQRNQALVKQCKARDNYTCQACGFYLKVNGKYVIECHHSDPIGAGGERETSLSDLVCLCPTCHRIAHTREEPLSVQEIAEINSPSNKKRQRTRSAPL